eukprot:TRINITY_DN12429_c0_g1_i1.p1 TRINITY_DN12429_c0_g1~~TRINITY_DN12429_c0_g1_i1.p1  ORF type:complete len:461 (+),score=107.85 TRINITY_DN12429_c0_g1_i1:73-1455(+)
MSAATVVKALRDTFDGGKTKSLEWRLSQLKALKQMTKDKEQDILDALKQDLGKCAMEGFLSEIAHVQGEIDLFISNLKQWAAPQRVATPLAQMKGLSTCEITPEPLGVVLIIGAWNYPFNLAIGPMIPAIAAGNCVLLKPSEVAVHTSRLLATLIPEYLDRACVAVIEGGVSETTEILKERFDHILYTGNGTVGKIVMRAAAEHLTPVTLELGGKSPAIVDPSASLDVAARRIVWGKFYNAGQTCIAVDHVFVHRSCHDALIEQIKANIKEFYGNDPKQAPDFGRIVNQRHVQRIASLLEGISKESIIAGGDIDEDQRYVAPTIVLNPDAETKLMKEEIFGPILPILPYDSLSDLLKGFKGKDKPLALYLFSSDSRVQQIVGDSTSSGQYVINDVLMQFTVPELPFGGVGASGMGRYHGYSGFETFSHKKSVLNKTTWFDLNTRYPPYNDQKLSLLKYLV